MDGRDVAAPAPEPAYPRSLRKKPRRLRHGHDARAAYRPAGSTGAWFAALSWAHAGAAAYVSADRGAAAGHRHGFACRVLTAGPGRQSARRGAGPSRAG